MSAPDDTVTIPTRLLNDLIAAAGPLGKALSALATCLEAQRPAEAAEAPSTPVKPKRKGGVS